MSPSDVLLGLPTDDVLRLLEVLAIVVATLIGWRQLQLLRRQQAAEHQRRRCDRALEFSLVRSPQLRDLREVVDKAFPPDRYRERPVPIDELDRRLRQDDHLRSAVLTLLAHWENLGLMIAADACDDQLAFEMVTGTLLGDVVRFRSFIDQRRQHDNPRSYHYLLSLADRWWRRLQRYGGRPYYWA